MDNFQQQQRQFQLPLQPISLRILFTEEHQWLKVNSHLSVCPGNGCSVDVCMYIRALCSHEIEKCPEFCSWCGKVQRWLVYHSQHCNTKKCPYYILFHETQKKFIKLSMRRIHRGSKDISEGQQSSLEPLTPHEEAKCCDDGSCCHTPLTTTTNTNTMESSSGSEFMQYGAFSNDIIKRALEERLPESENEIEKLIDTRQELRRALLHHHQYYKEGIHWERIKRLGCGSTGTTYCIRDRESAFWLALKEEEESTTTVDETFISLRLSSAVKDHPPNIVEFYGASLLPTPVDTRLQLFLELMPCCLQSYLYNGGPLSIEDSHNYCCQLFDALDYLHNKVKIIHSDIKPGNLLIDENIQRLKVADFGCAQVMEDSHQGYCMRGNAKAGTVHYNPPEHYSEYRCSYALDVWQAGCCFVAMVTGRRPWRSLYLDCKDRRYRAEVQHFQTQQISKGSYIHPVPGFLESSLNQLVKSCLNIDYRIRPSAKECLVLLIGSEVVSDSSKSQWLSHLDLQPTCFTPSLCLPSSLSSLCTIDVYLGSYFHYSYFSMLPGWLGSVSCDSHMTYSQLFPLIFSSIPVTQLFGSIDIVLCDNNPTLIWQKSTISTNTHHNNNTHHRHSLDDSITSLLINSLPRPIDSHIIDTNKAIVFIVTSSHR